jgi:hypothetical protein
MGKSELKTKETKESVEDFLNSIKDETVSADCQKIAAMMEKATGAKPKMWGANIVGFGERVLKYESGRELDWLEIAFSPRKQNLTLYVVDGSAEQSALLGKLGKHKTGKSCLYIKRLSDVDEEVLEEIIEKSVEKIRTK